jgi:hypothetical protein
MGEVQPTRSHDSVQSTIASSSAKVRAMLSNGMGIMIHAVVRRTPRISCKARLNEDENTLDTYLQDSAPCQLHPLVGPPADDARAQNSSSK